MMPDEIGTAEAAEICRLSPQKIRKHCRNGVFETARMVGSTWIIDRAEIEQYAAAVAALAKTDPRRGQKASE